jgi:hypothetical protein
MLSAPRASLAAPLLAAVLALVAPAAHSAPVDLPAPVRQALPEWRPLGDGRLRWFGLHIYDAALWSGSREFDSDRPFALVIRYARDFKGSHIAQSSVDELKRLGYRDPAKLTRWGQALERLLPDVKAGERLTGVYHPLGGVDLYSEDRALGTISDPEFAHAFFSIWLDPRTREPTLRERLIGRH